MNRKDILDNLSDRSAYPADTIRYCLDRPERTASIFLPVLNRAAAGNPLEANEETSLYLGIHLLAALKYQEALSPLLELTLTRPDRLGDLFGEQATAEMLSRVLMGICTSKAQILLDAAQTPGADFLVRNAFLRAWTFEVLEARVSPAEAEKGLRHFLESAQAAPEDDPIWSGWLTAIADLGFRSLKDLADRAQKQGRILGEDPTLAEREFQDFEQALNEAEEASSNRQFLIERGYVSFGDGQQDWGDAFMHAPQSG